MIEIEFDVSPLTKDFVCPATSGKRSPATESGEWKMETKAKRCEKVEIKRNMSISSGIASSPNSVPNFSSLVVCFCFPSTAVRRGNGKLRSEVKRGRLSSTPFSLFFSLHLLLFEFPLDIHRIHHNFIARADAAAARTSRFMRR